MKRENSPHLVLQATVIERNKMRSDHVNVKQKNSDDFKEGFD